MSALTTEEARELAQRWAAWRGAGEAAERAAELLARLNRSGVDAITPCHSAPRSVLEACDLAGLMTSTQCVKVDGDGFTIEPETWVTGWEFAVTPLADAERERLFAWVRARMADEAW